MRAGAGAIVRLRQEGRGGADPRAGDTADADGRHRRRGHVLQALFPERCEPAVTTAYAQAIAEQLIAHDALPKGSQVLAISKDGDALSLDMNEAFLAGLRESGSTGELMYMGSLVNTFLDNFNCTTVRVTVNGQSFSTGHS